MGWRAYILATLLVLIITGAWGGFTQTRMAPSWAPVAPGYPWSFPADHWSHPEFKTEWWYFTGQLESAANPGQRFGYQFTFFRVGLLPQTPDLDSSWAVRDLIMGHASISDLTRGKHWFSEVLWRNTPLFGGYGVHPDPQIVWSIGPPGTDEHWSLSWNGNGFDIRMRDQQQGMALALTVTPEKPLVFQGPGGVSRKGDQPEAASYYYSFTRMKTSGTITVGAIPAAEVTGTSWMDREFFTHQLTGSQAGWDWFSLQLDDGRDLMLYQLRNQEEKAVFGRGTLISPSGETLYLEQEKNWQLAVTETWTSPETGIRYPAGWKLELFHIPAQELSGEQNPGYAQTESPQHRIELELLPLIPDQENISKRSGLAYWEGAVTVRFIGEGASSAPQGRGYVELTGYGEGNRPPI